MMEKKDLGKKGEAMAASLLQRSGYEILARNFRSRFGEVDIVALDGETVEFVEVKTRWSKEYGKPEEAIGSGKLRSITKVGQYYRATHKELPEAERIDLVAIEMDDMGHTTRKELINNISGWG